MNISNNFWPLVKLLQGYFNCYIIAKHNGFHGSSPLTLECDIPFLCILLLTGFEVTEEIVLHILLTVIIF